MKMESNLYVVSYLKPADNFAQNLNKLSKEIHVGSFIFYYEIIYKL